MNKQEHLTINVIKAANEIKVQKLIEQMTIRANVDARKQAKLRGDNTYLGTSQRRTWSHPKDMQRRLS